MGNRKAPTPPDPRQVKPKPPPAPPAKMSRGFSVIVGKVYGSCELLWPVDTRCFLCGVLVPTNTQHRCERKP
jgi:hypothetical protein